MSAVSALDYLSFGLCLIYVQTWRWLQEHPENRAKNVTFNFRYQFSLPTHQTWPNSVGKHPHGVLWVGFSIIKKASKRNETKWNVNFKVHLIWDPRTWLALPHWSWKRELGPVCLGVNCGFWQITDLAKRPETWNALSLCRREKWVS